MKIKKIITNILIYIFLLLCSILLFAPLWIKDTFGDVSLDEIIFHFMVPLDGSDTTSYVIDGLIKMLLPALILSSFLTVILKYNYKYILKLEITIKSKKFILTPNHFFKPTIYILLFCFSLFFSISNLNIVDYIRLSLNKSTFIQENYIAPDEANIKFPENKRNLIYIFLESMESSYASIKEGGVLQHNLIPNLTKLANENISFSNSELLGGAMSTVGTTWTMGAMVSHFSGIPLKVSFDVNSYGDYSTFLPGITNLGDILFKEGYNQMFILGSDVAFGGRDKYMSQHGNFKIFDYTYAIENDYYNEEDYVWWGYDDNTLYKFAKEELLKLASKNKPFNLTLLTVDTHFEDGYVAEDAELKYNDNYSNAISCADNMIYEFINWIKQQDFYENTTIVIAGDHLTMDVDFFDDYDISESGRYIYNAIINSAITTTNTKNRQFSTLDLFPTTLASLGVTFDGNRLGLGTNLFSDEKTLIEKYGIKYLNEELTKKSSYYSNMFLFDKKTN